MRRIKVLKVVKTLDILGGAERMMYLLVKRLDKRRIDLSVCSLFEFSSETQQYLHEYGIQVFFLKPKKRIDFSFYHQLYSIIKQVQPQIIHSHNFHPNKYSRIVGCSFPIIRKIIHEHGTIKTKSKIQCYYDKALRRFTDKVIAVSESVAKSLIEHIGFSPHDISILPNGIDLDEYNISKKDRSAVRKSLGLNNRAVVVGMVARLHEHKDHITVLRAIARLIKNQQNIKLLLIGEGRTRRMIEEFISVLGIEQKVTLLGHRTDIRELMAAFDIAVLSSKTEGFGLSILEAMALKIPVIANSIEGIREILNHGENGLLFASGNVDSLYESINRLIHDKNLYRFIATNGHKTVIAKYHIENTVRRLESIYESMV